MALRQKKEPMEKVLLILPASLLDTIDKYAEEEEIDRTKFIRALLTTGILQGEFMKDIVLKGVSPEQLLSPEPLERLLAEKTLSYNAGILYAVTALRSAKGRRVRSNQRTKSQNRK